MTTPEWRYIQDIKNELDDLAPEAGEDLLDTFRALVDEWVEETL